MSEYTEHYNLELPKGTDAYNVQVANKNNQVIDNKLYEKVDKKPRQRPFNK